MSHAVLAFQTHIYSLLTGDATLMGKITGVYDRVAEGAAFPYVTITDITDNDRGNDTLEGNLIDLTVSVWSRDFSKVETLDIQADVDRILHRSDVENCTIGTSYNVLDFHRVSSTVLLDPDALTWHGVQTFEVLLGQY